MSNFFFGKQSFHLKSTSLSEEWARGKTRGTATIISMEPQKTKSEIVTKLIFVRKQQKRNSLFMQCDKNAFAVGMKAQNETQQIERNAQIKTEKSPVKPPKTPSSTKNTARETVKNRQNRA